MPHDTRIRPLPLWLKAGGSVFAIWHLLAIGLLVLEARSGPWPVPPPIGGVDQQVGPQFARVTFNAALPRSEIRPFQAYVRGLQMTHNYHFLSNDAEINSVYLEIQLRDKDKNLIKTVTFPDEKANFWVRHRQGILARGLAEDQPLPPQTTERIPAEGAAPKLVEFWEMTEPGILRLSKKPANQVPANQPVHHPSDAGKILAESYARYLCRENNAAEAEVIRHHRMRPLPVWWLIPNDPGPDTFTEYKSYFGVYRREE